MIDGIDALVTALPLLPTIRFGLPDTLRLQALCQLVGNFIQLWQNANSGQYPGDQDYLDGDATDLFKFPKGD